MTVVTSETDVKVHVETSGTVITDEIVKTGRPASVIDFAKNKQRRCIS